MYQVLSWWFPSGTSEARKSVTTSISKPLELAAERVEWIHRSKFCRVTKEANQCGKPAEGVATKIERPASCHSMKIHETADVFCQAVACSFFRHFLLESCASCNDGIHCSGSVDCVLTDWPGLPEAA